MREHIYHQLQYWINIVNCILLIIVILIRSPDDQSLQENLGPFGEILGSPRQARNFFDTLIKILLFCYIFSTLIRFFI